METDVLEKIERKCFTPEIKLDTDGEGTFEAVFATMNVIDKDGDLTLNGAFGQQNVKVSQYNHGSWGDGVNALPIGVGKIFERGNDAVIQGKLNLDSQAGLETYKTLKFIQEQGHSQEWSYALPQVDYEFREQDGKRIRVLKRIMVPEVSPVLMGAGENTRMLNIKSQKTEEETTEEPEKKTFAEQSKDCLDSLYELVKRFREIAELRKIAGKSVSSESTDMLLKIYDEFQPVMTELKTIYDSVGADKSNYLMLKKLNKEFNHGS